MSRRKWPESVPILTGEDILQDGRYHELDICPEEDISVEYEGRSCLVGWTRRTFEPGNVLEKARLILSNQIPQDYGITYWNDDIATAEEAAQVWNRAMAKLGYTEGNPEA